MEQKKVELFQGPPTTTTTSLSVSLSLPGRESKREGETPPLSCSPFLSFSRSLATKNKRWVCVCVAETVECDDCGGGSGGGFTDTCTPPTSTLVGARLAQIWGEKKKRSRVGRCKLKKKLIIMIMEQGLEFSIQLHNLVFLFHVFIHP